MLPVRQGVQWLAVHGPLLGIFRVGRAILVYWPIRRARQRGAVDTCTDG